jgi:signal transduction histidine kinase
MSVRTITGAAGLRLEPFHDEVEAELVRHLYRQATVAVLATLLGSCVIAYLLWNVVVHAHMVAWLLAHAAVGVLRLVTINAYFRRAPPKEQARRWATVSAAGTLLSGVLWALACFLFVDPREPLILILLSVSLLALSGGAVASHGVYFPSYWAYIGPTMGALVAVSLWHGGLLGNTVALVAAFSAVIYFALARNVRRLFADSLRLGFENVALRRDAEEKTGLLEATLDELKRREAALEAARRSAEQANAAKTRFLAAASHDLRQPIHALGLLFATLADHVRDEQTRPLLEQIDDALQAVDSMLSSLLDISKLDAGVVRPTIGPVDVAALLQRLNSEQQPIAELTGNRLRVRVPNAFAHSDASMLHRILANLISNALRYTCNGRILVGARPRGDSIRIDVIDTGPGIPPESLEEIFVEFHQLGNPERDRRHGLGLGLAIVKRLTGLLGHQLEVRSVVGRGSRFSITLPRTFEPQQAGQRSGADVPLGADVQGCRVLLLDDEVSVLESMRSFLEHWGCEVITTATPEEAEAQLHSEGMLPDLLIVDYRLRRHASGIETIARLHQLAGRPIPALVITGDTAPDRLREAQASGYLLLHKPVTPGQLRTAMRQLVRRTGAQA